MKRLAIVAGLVLALVVGLFVFGMSGWFQGQTPCTLDRLMVDTPEGWELSRDGYNGCDWTLFNEDGDRAPRDLYDGTAIDYPGSPVFYPLRLLGIALTLASLVGLGWLFVGRRRIQPPNT